MDLEQYNDILETIDMIIHLYGTIIKCEKVLSFDICIYIIVFGPFRGGVEVSGVIRFEKGLTGFAANQGHILNFDG